MRDITVKVGDLVWKAGDAWSYEELIKITTQFEADLANEFWGRLYFDSQQAAAYRTAIAHAEYGEYQERASHGYLY